MCWALFVSGCASVDLRPGFSDVSSSVQERLAMPVFWNNGTDLDHEASNRLEKLLSEKITADDMVGIKPERLEEKVRALLPAYMTMGNTGMDKGENGRGDAVSAEYDRDEGVIGSVRRLYLNGRTFHDHQSPRSIVEP